MLVLTGLARVGDGVTWGWATIHTKAKMGTTTMVNIFFVGRVSIIYERGERREQRPVWDGDGMPEHAIST